MSSIIILLIAVAVIILGYFGYARLIDKKVFQPDDKKATPSKMFMDGVDFSPANKSVLFGYQFKSIAALGPITGPIVAVQFGWLPALLWVLLGTFLMGWVQDYSSIMVSMREEGKTYGAMSYQLISPRARTILLVFIYFYLLLIMAAFGKIVGFDLLTNPSVPLGVLIIVIVGMLAGQMTYKWKMDILLTSAITVIISLAGIYLSGLPIFKNLFTSINGGTTSPVLFGSVTWAQFLWSLVALILCYFASVLPIWRWAQPINYVAFWIVFLGILGGTLGLVIWNPSISPDFKAFTNFNVKGLGYLWPILFVTIACGAISGWHSLVSSSGTSRQIEKETDAKMVGAGAMFLEMFLATFSILAVVAAFAASKGLAGYQEMMAQGKTAGIFAIGLSEILSKIGLPKDFGMVYASVFLVLMAIAIMFLVTRFMRVASAEFMGEKIPLFRNNAFGSIIALLLSAIMIWTGFWQRVWVLFGGANQLMASLALLIISLWLISKGKNYLWAFIPFIFMFITTIAALILTGWGAIKQIINTPDLPIDKVIGNYIAAAISLLLIIAALILAYDGVKAVFKLKEKKTTEKK